MFQPPCPLLLLVTLLCILPRHSRETRLCVCNSIEDKVGRRFRNWQTGANAVEGFPSRAPSFPLPHKSFHSQQMSIKFTEKHTHLHTLRTRHFFGGHLVIRRDGKFGKLSLCASPSGACHVETALLRRTDRAALWSLRLSDLFCFTGLSNRIARRSRPLLVLPTKWSDRDETDDVTERIQRTAGANVNLETVLKHVIYVVLTLLYLDHC